MTAVTSISKLSLLIYESVTYLNIQIFPPLFEFEFAHLKVIYFSLIPSGWSYPNISPPTNIPLWKLGIFVDKNSQVRISLQLPKTNPFSSILSAYK